MKDEHKNCIETTVNGVGIPASENNHQKETEKEEKLKEINWKFQELHTLVSSYQRPHELYRLKAFQVFLPPAIQSQTWMNFLYRCLEYFGCCVVVCVAVFAFFLIVVSIDWPVSNESLVRTWLKWYDSDINTEACLLDKYSWMDEVFRPPVECDFCHNLEKIDKVANITPEEFESKYAYNAVPVVVIDGALNWKALSTFSFEFFKKLYPATSPVLTHDNRCQFFDYKKQFDSLQEVFDMSPERAHLESGTDPWYIGWSNCDSKAADILRDHYKKPYFLPRNAESSRTDWVFMGSPGYGAVMHIDFVGRPSWQAQISGTKLWTLRPPPECYWQCAGEFQVTVQPGEIIVLDTNVWYHSTLILGKDFSITIGSEYD